MYKEEVYKGNITNSVQMHDAEFILNVQLQNKSFEIMNFWLNKPVILEADFPLLLHHTNCTLKHHCNNSLSP